MKAFLSLLALAATTLGTAQAQSTGPGSQSGSTSTHKSTAGTKSATQTGSKATSGAAGKIVVSSGGQGHNSVPDPKGKVLVAPSVTTTGKGAAKPAAKH